MADTTTIGTQGYFGTVTVRIVAIATQGYFDEIFAAFFTNVSALAEQLLMSSSAEALSISPATERLIVSVTEN